MTARETELRDIIMELLEVTSGLVPPPPSLPTPEDTRHQKVLVEELDRAVRRARESLRS